MVHGLAIRKGTVSILCNGRPAVKKNGTIVNGFKGGYKDLIANMKITEDNKTRILIPQDNLTDHVECDKCSCLMDPAKRKKYMKDIYKNSFRWKTRKANRKAQKHNLLKTFNQSVDVTPTQNVHKAIEIPAQKTCIIQISFV